MVAPRFTERSVGEGRGETLSREMEKGEEEMQRGEGDVEKREGGMCELVG
jgi:hypothetical protein